MALSHTANRDRHRLFHLPVQSNTVIPTAELFWSSILLSMASETTQQSTHEMRRKKTSLYKGT